MRLKISEKSISKINFLIIVSFVLLFILIKMFFITADIGPKIIVGDVEILGDTWSRNVMVYNNDSEHNFNYSVSVDIPENLVDIELYRYLDNEILLDKITDNKLYDFKVLDSNENGWNDTVSWTVSASGEESFSIEGKLVTTDVLLGVEVNENNGLVNIDKTLDIGLNPLNSISHEPQIQINYTHGMDILGYNENYSCTGTELDPCVAGIEFIPRTDVIVPPTSGTWLFDTSVPMKELRFYLRKKTPTGFNFTRIFFNETRTFYAGTTYVLYIEGVKFDPYQSIKWSFGDIDPYWFGPFGDIDVYKDLPIGTESFCTGSNTKQCSKFYSDQPSCDGDACCQWAPLDEEGTCNTRTCASLESPACTACGCTAGSTAPTYSLNSTNSTTAGQPIQHNLKWHDDTALSGYIFSFYNGSDNVTTANYTYNWTSSDQETGSKVFYGESNSTTTHYISYYNTTSYSLATMYWDSPNVRTPWGGTNASAANYSNAASMNSAYSKICSDATNDEPYWRFNFTIAENVNNIEWINITHNGYYTLATGTETASAYYYNYTSGGWVTIGTLNKDTATTVSVNITSGFSNYISNGQLVLYVEGDSFDGGECINTDYATAIVGYNSTSTTYDSEANKTWYGYYSIGGSGYQHVDLVKIIVTIDSYDPRASINNEPDLEIAIYNGSSYVNGTYCNINNTMGNNALNDTDWNCTVTKTDSQFLNSWNASTNRQIMLRGVWMDKNATYTDNITWINVFAHLDAWNTTTTDYSFRNDTWVSMTGTNNWSNVTKVVNSTLGALIKWRVYANNSGNEWNTSPIYSYYTTSANPWLNVSLQTPDPNACTSGSPCNWNQYSTYWINATVRCVNANCGSVNGTVRYNDTASTMKAINTTEGATPFYITYPTSGDKNPLSCGNMNQNDVCYLNWTVNATGNLLDIYRIDVNFTSDNTSVSSNDTSDGYVKISESTPPTYSNNQTNNTVASQPTLFSLRWTDNVNLSSYIFSIDNCTGSFSNTTEASFPSAPTNDSWSNQTYVINSTAVCTIRWCVYANDTSNNWNGTSCSNPFSFVTIPNYCNYSIQEWELPYTIGQNNSYYCLASNDYVGGQTAITFPNNFVQNSTLDCLGFNLDSNDTSGTYGINLSYNGADKTKNITIKNCNITDFNYGIYLYGPDYVNITNNTITSCIDGIRISLNSDNATVNNNTVNDNGDPGPGYGYGIDMFSSDAEYYSNFTNNIVNNNERGIWVNGNGNIFINNTVTNSADMGFTISSPSTDNNVTGGSISNNTIDYYATSGYSIATNYFRDTNFTASRTIEFGLANSFFVYNNRTDIELWLKTNVSSTFKTITRTLNSWTQTNMSWNESVTSGTVTANYSITGLLTNTNYTVYNFSVLAYTINASSCGCLNFIIALNTTSRTIQVNAVDSTPPTYSNVFNNVTNNTAVNAGAAISLGAKWSDNYQLSMYVNSTKVNSSGSWTNGTWQSFAAGNWSNFTVIFPSEAGSNLTVQIYANDTSGNQNVTATWFWYNATPTVTCSVAIGLSGNLTNGIIFGSVTSGATNDAPGNNGTGITNYYVTVQTSGCSPSTVNVYTKASGDLTSGSYSISLTNEKFRNSTTDNTVPAALQNISLTTTYTDNQIGSLLNDGAYVYLKYFLYVPGGQQAGNYNNTIYFWAGKSDLSP